MCAHFTVETEIKDGKGSVQGQTSKSKIIETDTSDKVLLYVIVEDEIIFQLRSPPQHLMQACEHIEAVDSMRK